MFAPRVSKSQDLEFIFFYFQKTCITSFLFTMNFILQWSSLKLRGSGKPPALHLANFSEERERSQPKTCGGPRYCTVSCKNKVVFESEQGGATHSNPMFLKHGSIKSCIMRSAQSFHVYTLTHCRSVVDEFTTLSWFDLLQLFDQLGLFLFLLNKYILSQQQVSRATLTHLINWPVPASDVRYPETNLDRG